MMEIVIILFVAILIAKKSQQTLLSKHAVG